MIPSGIFRARYSYVFALDVYFDYFSYLTFCTFTGQQLQLELYYNFTVMHWLFIARSYLAVLAWDACVATCHFLLCFLIYGIRKNEIKNFKCKGGFYTSVRFLVLATPRQPLTFSPHPSPGSSPSFDRVELGTRETKMAPDFYF